MPNEKVRIVINLSPEHMAALDLVRRMARKRRGAVVSDIVREYVQPIVDAMAERAAEREAEERSKAE